VDITQFIGVISDASCPLVFLAVGLYGLRAASPIVTAYLKTQEERHKETMRVLRRIDKNLENL